jgi:hypothetical protein
MASRSNWTSRTGKPAVCSTFDVGSTFDGVQHRRNLLGRAAHCIEIVAIELDRNVAAHTRDQFVEAQLDRLADLKRVADKWFELGFNAFDHIVLGARRRQAIRGFRMMNVSDALGGIGSLATSAVPVLE